MDATRRTALGLLATSGLAAATSTRPALAAAPMGMPRDGDWHPLFNGRDLSGWTLFLDGVGDRDRYGAIGIEGDVLHVLGPQYRGPTRAAMGYLATDRVYENYHLSLEYKWGTLRYDPRTLYKRDSGILYHVPPGHEMLWPDCVEYQIMEYHTGDALPINHRAIEAISLGGMPSWPEDFPGNTRYAPQVDAGGNLRQWIHADGTFDTLEGWNTVELIAQGDKAAHIVNGRIVTAIYGLQSQDPADKSRYVPLKGGRILLQIEGAEIMFRNIKIRAL
ncbi:3-keto-disaccharide hydrolase [Novosphingobium sp.]|uniref:3-keto-disaccharide hydrolase n=1 Tax=Novosphingobium sp. TaxID=1874826 RepID=UPI003D0F3898